MSVKKKSKTNKKSVNKKTTKTSASKRKIPANTKKNSKKAAKKKVIKKSSSKSVNKSNNLTIYQQKLNEGKKLTKKQAEVRGKIFKTIRDNFAVKYKPNDENITVSDLRKWAEGTKNAREVLVKKLCNLNKSLPAKQANEELCKLSNWRRGRHGKELKILCTNLINEIKNEHGKDKVTFIFCNVVFQKAINKDEICIIRANELVPIILAILNERSIQPKINKTIDRTPYPKDIGEIFNDSVNYEMKKNNEKINKQAQNYLKETKEWETSSDNKWFENFDAKKEDKSNNNGKKLEKYLSAFRPSPNRKISVYHTSRIGIPEAFEENLTKMGMYPEPIKNAEKERADKAIKQLKKFEREMADDLATLLEAKRNYIVKKTAYEKAYKDVFGLSLDDIKFDV